MRPVAGTALIMLCALAARAGDWPQFHHDSARTGNAPDEELQLPLKLNTCVKLEAPIYASPAAVNDRVYVQDGRGNIVCVDGPNNKLVWRTPTGGVNNMSSPCVAGGKVYVGSTDGHLYILNAADGKVLKKIETPGPILAAPAFAGDAVYFACTFFKNAANRVDMKGLLCKLGPDGNVIWRYEEGTKGDLEFAVQGGDILFPSRWGSGYGEMFYLKDEGQTCKLMGRWVDQIYSPFGGPAFVGTNQYAVLDWDGEGGHVNVFSLERLWKKLSWEEGRKVGRCMAGMGADSPVATARSTPAARGNVVVYSFGFGLAGVDLDKSGTKDSSVFKIGDSKKAPLSFQSSPALAKDHCVAGANDGGLYVVPLKGGVAWRFEVRPTGTPNCGISSSPAVSNGRVYFGGEDGYLYGLGPGPEVPKAGEPVTLASGDKKPAGAEWPSSYGGDFGGTCVSPSKTIKPPFALSWRTRVWDSFKGAPAIADGMLFIQGRHGHVFGLDADAGEILWRQFEPHFSRNGVSVSGGKVFAYLKELVCFDARTGKRLWAAPRPPDVASPGWYDVCRFAPCVVSSVVTLPGIRKGDKGYFPVLQAWDTETGKPAWAREFPDLASPSTTFDPWSNIFLSPGVTDGERCYVSVGVAVLPSGKRDVKEATETKGLTFCLDPKTGAETWKTDKHFLNIVRDALSVKNGVLLLAHGTALDAKTGGLLWEKPRISSDSALHPCVTDQFLASKGEKGSLATSDNGWCTGPIAAESGWGFSGNGRDATLVAGPLDGKIEWKFPTPCRSCPRPAVAYDRLYYAPNGEGFVYCFAPAPSFSKEAK